MSTSTPKERPFRFGLWTFMLAALALFPLPAADHGDTPLLRSIPRHDGRLTDLFAFTRGENLVLIVDLDPTIPLSATDYQFAPDLRVEILIDNDSLVTFDDPDDLEIFGGTIVNPRGIQHDIRLRLEFKGDGTPILETAGLPYGAEADVQLFAGLRDDPFIRAPRTGRNIAALVLELPLEHVLESQETILVWAVSRIDDLQGPFQELVGRSLRSQFPENIVMNTAQPRRHFRLLGVAPDVVIYDTSEPAAFPNGRELTDDVVDLVGDPRVLMNDQPFPTENDLPFLDDFPYLAPPHAP